jgi:hypothetical protein
MLCPDKGSVHGPDVSRMSPWGIGTGFDNKETCLLSWPCGIAVHGCI